MIHATSGFQKLIEANNLLGMVAINWPTSKSLVKCKTFRFTSNTCTSYVKNTFFLTSGILERSAGYAFNDYRQGLEMQLFRKVNKQLWSEETVNKAIVG